MKNLLFLQKINILFEKNLNCNYILHFNLKIFNPLSEFSQLSAKAKYS